MSRRPQSMTPAAIRSRELRFNLWLKREEDQFNSEVKHHMNMGLSFDDAWTAAGGLVVSHIGLSSEGMK